MEGDCNGERNREAPVKEERALGGDPCWLQREQQRCHGNKTGMLHRRERCRQ